MKRSRIKRYFQWMPWSDHEGVVSLVSIYLENGIKYYVFSDDEVCAEEFVSLYTTDINAIGNKLIVEIGKNSAECLWKFQTIKSRTSAYYDDVKRGGDDSGRDFEVPTSDDYYGKGHDSGTFNSNIGKKKVVPPATRCYESYLQNPIDYTVYMEDEDLYELGLKERPKPEPKPEPVKTPEPVPEPKAETPAPTIEETVEVFEKQTPAPEPKEKPAVKYSDDPVDILVGKATKYPSTISLDLTVNLPSKSLYGIVIDSFEDGRERFINNILDGIDYNAIRNSLKESLLQAYSE